METARLSHLADELHALSNRLLLEHLLLGYAPRQGTLDPFRTAGRMIAEIVAGGGLPGAEFAGFRAAVRTVAESPGPSWFDVLDAGIELLPVEPRVPATVASFVASRVRQGLAVGEPKPPEPAADPLPPLTERQQEAFDLIRDHGPLTGKEIASRMGVSESAVTGTYVPHLKRHGVRNVKGRGYYVQTALVSPGGE